MMIIRENNNINIDNNNKLSLYISLIRFLRSDKPIRTVHNPINEGDKERKKGDGKMEIWTTY